MGSQMFGKHASVSAEASVPFQQYVGLQATVDIVPTPSNITACDLSVIPQADFLQQVHYAPDAPTSVRSSPATMPHPLERSMTSTMLSPKRDSMVRKFSMRKLNIETSVTHRGSDDEGSGGYGSDDGRQQAAQTTSHHGYRMTAAQDAMMHRTNMNLLNDMDEKRCTDIFHSILTGGGNVESKQNIGIVFQNIRVESNSIRELHIGCSFKHIQQQNITASQNVSNDTSSTSFLRHPGSTICSVRVTNALLKWRRDIPCLLNENAPALYAHVLVPRHVNTVNVEILFHESSLFKRKETMLVVHTHECFFREIQGASNIEKSWTIPAKAGYPTAFPSSNDKFIPSASTPSTPFCFDSTTTWPDAVSHINKCTAPSTPKWSLLHKIADDIHVIHDPQVSIADSAYLRWELHKNGMLCHYHAKDITTPSILSYGGDEHTNQCNTCFVQKDTWAQEQSTNAAFCHFFDDVIGSATHNHTAIHSSASSMSSPNGKDAITYIKRRVNSSTSSKSHSMAGKLELMKRYIDVLSSLTNQEDIPGKEGNEDNRKVLLLTDSVVIRKDLEEHLAEHMATLSNRKWDILLLGAYWWENKNNPSTNPLISELQNQDAFNAFTSSSSSSEQSAAASASIASRLSPHHFTFHKRNETLPTRMSQMTENPEWQLHSLQPIGFSCPYSTFAMVLRTRDVQCKVLEFFKHSLAQNINAFQMFHLWANGEFEHRAFVCVPNLFMLHPHYDEVGANLVNADEMSVTLSSNMPLQTTKKPPIYSFKNYSREHIMYWDIDRYSWLDESMLRGAVIPSSLSLLPSVLNLPLVHVFIFIDTIMGSTEDVLSQLIMTLSSFSNQTYAHIRIAVFYPHGLKSQLCEIISQYNKLQRLYQDGNLDCIPVEFKKMNSFQSSVANYTLHALRTNYAYNNVFVLVEKIGVLSLPHRASMLVKHGALIKDTQKRTLNHLLAAQISDQQISSSVCIPASTHAYSTFTLLAYFYHAFLLRHEITATRGSGSNEVQRADDSISFVSSFEQWTADHSGTCETIPCILAFCTAKGKNVSIQCRKGNNNKKKI